ncbi:M15 family metallopeptidase [Flavobacterium beibuense]|uniref:D-alanyl-D-alanine dipeptidase n=1 Tax=Flavobacterium beibuense TaxID=657326 RepID=A0A444W7Y9_9FLAO|nr:M15 family metallopeptidase [Flavobacterium beibuense]RYJ41758.1 Peptidase family M15D-like protein [Flavobacterium beibuense]
MKTFGVIVLVVVIFALSTTKVDDKRLTEDFHQAIVMKDTSDWAEIKMDTLGMVNKMAYADTANFMNQKIYPCARCFLRLEVAEALEKANTQANAKNLKLVIFDCYRPYGYQQKMYEIVNNPRYVAPPGKGSNHNRGAAVDLSLADENGNLLDMGNEFDDFSSLSHYISDKISEKAQNNRKLLRGIMTEAGFMPYDNEWWHFDYRKKKYETSDFRWECNEQTQQ